jgi:hypothetical protein
MKKRLAMAMAVFLSLATGMSLAQVSEIDAQDAESAILSAGTRAGRIAAIREVPSVGVVNLNYHRGPLRDDSIPEPQEFRISAAKHAAGIRRMRAALRANPVTREALAAHGVSINAIIGVKVSSNGSLRLYVLR